MARDTDAAEQIEAECPTLAMPKLSRAGSEGFQIETVQAWTAIPSLTLTCSDCAGFLEQMHNVRVKSKCQGTFRCGKCAYTITRMFREDGAGATSFVPRMSESDKQQWFRDAQSASTGELFHMMRAANQRYCERERRFSFGGAFKARSVLKTLGYDPEVIAKDSLPEDARGDRMWGLVYRVPELTVEEAGREGKRGETTEALNSKRRRLKAPVNDPDAAAEPAASGAGEVGASNDSSESSSTSSSSASTPRSKKEKAAKKNRKHEQKEKKRAAKEKRKQIEALKREKAAKKEEEKAARAAAAQEAKAA